VASVTVGERPTIRRNELGVPTPVVTLVREAPEPALPTPAVTLALGVPEPAVPTPTTEAPRRGGVASEDCGEGVFRLTPTHAAAGTAVPVGTGEPQGE